MPKNRLEDLRNHLFETLEALKDEDKPMEIDRARAVADVAREIISSAKLEMQFMDLTGQQPQSDSMVMRPALLSRKSELEPTK